MSESLTVRLPYPPSANRLWRTFRGRHVRSPEYETWLQHAAAEVKRTVLMSYDRKGVAGPYVLTVKVCPPDRRQRDIDNTIKPLGDVLQKGGAVENDRLCQRLEIEWCPNTQGVVCTIMATKLRIPRRGAA